MGARVGAALRVTYGHQALRNVAAKFHDTIKACARSDPSAIAAVGSENAHAQRTLGRKSANITRVAQRSAVVRADALCSGIGIGQCIGAARNGAAPRECVGYRRKGTPAGLFELQFRHRSQAAPVQVSCHMARGQVIAGDITNGGFVSRRGTAGNTGGLDLDLVAIK